MRGHKVNFIRYVNNDAVEDKIKTLENAGVVDRNIESNIPLADYEITEDSGSGNFKLDKAVSGQYLIHGVDIKYNNNTWDYNLILIRPKFNRIDIIKDKN
jgi:hypothetical protein